MTAAVPQSTPSGPPTGLDGPRIPLYTPEYAADPHRAHREMRKRHASLAPVLLDHDVPATLVISYRTATRILNDPDHFPADPRAWQKTMPPDHPILHMLSYGKHPLRTSGAEHARYRQATTAAIDGVDLHALHATVERLATPLINGFCTTGSADLLTQYAYPLTFSVINDVLGVPQDIGLRVAEGMAELLRGGDAAAGSDMTLGALLELLALRREQPGDDITSRLIAHPARLDQTELVDHVALIYGSGIEPALNLIVNTMALILTDERFAGGVLGGSLSYRDALEEVLFNDPPMANYCITFPRQPIQVDDVWLPANQPVVISMMACNRDPAIRGDEVTGNRSHLAWSTGPHACPGRSIGTVLAYDAIDQLLDALPDMTLAIPADELRWRPSSFNRSLTSLPVTFPISPPLNLPTR